MKKLSDNPEVGVMIFICVILCICGFMANNIITKLNIQSQPHKCKTYSDSVNFMVLNSDNQERTIDSLFKNDIKFSSLIVDRFQLQPKEQFNTSFYDSLGFNTSEIDSLTKIAIDVDCELEFVNKCNLDLTHKIDSIKIYGLNKKIVSAIYSKEDRLRTLGQGNINYFWSEYVTVKYYCLTKSDAIAVSKIWQHRVSDSIIYANGYLFVRGKICDYAICAERNYDFN